jgi:chromosome segregation ATPase
VTAPIASHLLDEGLLDIAEDASARRERSADDYELLGQSYLELEAEARRKSDEADTQRNQIDALNRIVTDLRDRLELAQLESDRLQFAFSCAAETVDDLKRQLGKLPEDDEAPAEVAA